MGVAYAYPDTYRIDRLRDSYRMAPNLTGSSVAFDAHWETFLDPTDVGEYFQKTQEGASDIELLINRAEASSGYAFLSIISERTLTVKQDNKMSLLMAVASLGDIGKFAETVSSMAWDLRPIEDFLSAIKLALKCGAHEQARKLATAGGQRFLENVEMQKYARILAPSKIVNGLLPPDHDAAADMQWIKANGEKYRGQWVALRGGTLLASDFSRNELLVQLVNPKDKSILITKVY